MKMPFDELKNKKILILGFGREGKDNYLALRKLFPDKVLGIADRLKIKDLRLKIKDQGFKKVKWHLGEDYLKSLKNYDLIIRTPGIPLSTIKPFLEKRTRITSQTEIFLENCPGRIVGVTGTKGKGTTASLIEQILKKGGLKARLIGNIGKPVFQTLLRAKENEIFVYEMSSHQLQNLKKSPHIAVFLNLYPAHLNYYKSFKEYQKAKENIAKWQTKKDFFIYNSDESRLREMAKKSEAKKIPFGIKKIKELEKIIYRKEIPLKGEFNLLNVMAAVSVGKILNIPLKKIGQGVKSFKPLAHRLELAGKYKGIEFYNDSLATVPQATEGALEALGERVETLILGGFDRGKINFSSLAKTILKKKVKTLIFLDKGAEFSQSVDTGKKIWKKILLLRRTNLPKSFFTPSMQTAVKIAYKTTKKEGICLLSPAASSFNLFRDYRERGNLFKRFVKKYDGASKSSKRRSS